MHHLDRLAGEELPDWALIHGEQVFTKERVDNDITALIIASSSSRGQIMIEDQAGTGIASSGGRSNPWRSIPGGRRNLPIGLC
jgi:hypothetical protein